MKEKTLEKLSEEIKDWHYVDTLPEEWFGYKLIKQNCDVGDKYDLFTYENEAANRSATAYFHEETMEYKFRVHIGLTNFCQIQYITSKLSTFEENLKKYLEHSIQDLAEYNPDSLGYIMREQRFTDWDYKDLLPDELEGFKLYIRPSAPVRVLNGSYIIFDYSDFDIESNFIIYYNEFRSEFYGEARIRKIPEMNYVFDAKIIPELEDKIRTNLIKRLHEIREKAIK